MMILPLLKLQENINFVRDIGLLFLDFLNEHADS